jgi:hypothetical protein
MCNLCCLVPFNSFAEYAPEPNPETKKKDVVWFALNHDRPLTRAFFWLPGWPATTLGSPLVSPEFLGCHGPADRGQRTGRQLLSRRGTGRSYRSAVLVSFHPLRRRWSL